MKNWQMSLIGLVNGGYFLTLGTQSGVLLTQAAGVLLISLSLMPLIDQAREQKLGRRLRLHISYPFKALAKYFAFHKARVSALFQLYNMAPTIIENQIRIEAFAQKMRSIDGRVEMWRRLAQNSGPSFNADPTQSRLSLIGHNEQSDGNLMQAIANAEELKVRANGPRLIISDIGTSDLPLQTLNDYLDGQVELDFWIVKNGAEGADVLILDHHIIASQPGVVSGVAEKMSKSYAHVALLVRRDAAADLDESQKWVHPSGQPAPDLSGPKQIDIV